MTLLTASLNRYPQFPASMSTQLSMYLLMCIIHLAIALAPESVQCSLMQVHEGRQKFNFRFGHIDVSDLVLSLTVTILIVLKSSVNQLKVCFFCLPQFAACCLTTRNLPTSTCSLLPRVIDCFTAHQHRKVISAKKRC